MSQRNEGWMQAELDDVTHWLIRHAARLAPEDVSSRLEEEWLADSECRSSAASRLRFAVGCCWATAVIVHEYPRDRVPVAAPSPVVAMRGVIAVADRHTGYVSLRSGTLFLIVGLHAVLFCGLITTLSRTQGFAASRHAQSHAAESVPAEIEIMSLLPAR